MLLLARYRLSSKNMSGNLMKDKNIVGNLIAQLKNQATNDFELHRIEVLEKDLFNPPRVEIVDDNYQKFDGVKYRKLKGKNRYACSRFIHQAVYAYYHGEISEGYDIHHEDWNSFNNEPENLICVSKAAHQQIHYGEKILREHLAECAYCGKKFKSVNNAKYCSRKCWYEGRKPEKICENCGKPFKARSENTRTCSAQCAGQLKQKESSIQQICPVCGKEFTTKKKRGRKTCSQECYRQLIGLRQKSKKKFEERICIICGEKFIVEKVRKKTCCSDKCRRTLAWETKHLENPAPTEKTCPICGKIFLPKRRNIKTCSRECSIKMTLQTKQHQHLYKSKSHV